MIGDPIPLNALWRLMDQEVTSYEALLDDMRQEWECLKKEDTISLIPLLHAKETHISMIKRIRESMAQILVELMGEGGGQNLPWTLLNLAPLVSPPQAKRIKHHQNLIDRFRQQIIFFNEQNKRFIQETLNYLKDLFSLLISPIQEAPIYIKDGRKIPTPLPPSCMSKKV